MLSLLARNSKSPVLTKTIKDMKAQKFFWLLIPLALASATGMYLASCHDSADELQPNTETVAPATEENAETNIEVVDQELSFRSCTCSMSCPMDLVIVSGSNVNVTICGDLNGATSCTSFTSSCGSNNYPFAKTFNSSGCFCVANGRSFRVTNNSLSSVTFDIVVTGGSGTYGLSTTVTLGSGASQDFQSPSSPTCDDEATICP